MEEGVGVGGPHFFSFVPSITIDIFGGGGGGGGAGESHANRSRIVAHATRTGRAHTNARRSDSRQPSVCFAYVYELHPPLERAVSSATRIMLMQSDALNPDSQTYIPNVESMQTMSSTV